MPRVLIQLVFEDEVKVRNGILLVGKTGLENLGRGREIEGLDLDVGNWGYDVGERVGERIEVEFGVEDRMGDLE